MKKCINIFIICALLISSMFPTVVFASDEIKVMLNDIPVRFDVPPQIINDRTMVPLRAIFEALGSDVEWDGNTQTVTASKEDTFVVATIGSENMYVNGIKKIMDVVPIIINARTLVPVRFIAEAFDCLVEWLEDSQTVEITTQEEYKQDFEDADDNDYKAEENSAEYNEKYGRYLPRHAPNMYVDWITDNEYDAICVDWYCEEDAENTYWAVHNWNSGYAGFQNKDGKHVILLSLWDLDDGTTPTIEYVRDGLNGNFGGEGTGKQVFTNYNWGVGKWYSMCIQVSSDSKKSYYTQYVKEENSEWIKTATISYPRTGDYFTRSSIFQEDFTFNNLSRSCRVKNACGRIYGATEWESWNECKISNSYFTTMDATWDDGVEWNVTFDCDWKSTGDYVWIQSGGSGFKENGKVLQSEYTLNNIKTPSLNDFRKDSEDNTPTPSNKSISDGTYVIATKLNQSYVLDIDGGGTSNGDNLQLWGRNNTPAQSFKVTHLGNGYYRIVNVNSDKAIDAEWGGTVSGTNVWQYDVNDTPAQIWKIVSAGDGSYYIINKESGLYLDVDNANADYGTNVKLFDRNDAYDAQKWCFIKQ